MNATQGVDLNHSQLPLSVVHKSLRVAFKYKMDTGQVRVLHTFIGTTSQIDLSSFLDSSFAVALKVRFGFLCRHGYLVRASVPNV